jgi:hypothetical protein
VSQEAERRGALVPDLAADAAGAVADQDPAQADLLHGVRGPEVAAGEQLHLLLDGELVEERAEPGLVR